MDEISQIESELRRLREEADHQKRKAASAEKERTTLEAKNEYLVNKLKEASYVYGEAGKRLLYFINNQVNPITERLNKLEKTHKELASRDKVIGDSLIDTETTMKGDFTKMDKRILALSSELKSAEERLMKSIKGYIRKSERGDAGLEGRFSAAMAEAEKRTDAMKAASEKKGAARNAALEKRLEGKMDTLRERSLLLSRDIEELSKFESDIQGAEGRIQAAAATITQLRLDMEKLSQSLKAEVAAAKGALKREMGTLSSDVEKNMLSLSAQLREADEKNLGTVRLAVEKNQKTLENQLEDMRSAMTAFEDTVNAASRRSEGALKKEMDSFVQDVEKRLRMLESGISGNAKSQKQFEGVCAGKFEENFKRFDALEDNSARLESELRELIDALRQSVGAKFATFGNHLERLEKSADHKISRAASQLEKQGAATIAKMNRDFLSNMASMEKKGGLLGKDIENMKSGLAQIEAISSELAKRKEETSQLEAKTDSLYQQMTDKSEKDDMKLNEHMQILESKIKGSIEAAESRMVKESVRSFSAARHSLKKDIHSLREESAALKAELKNLRGLLPMMSDLQQGVAASGRKADETQARMEQLSSSVSSTIEKEALKASKEMAGVSARLKSDLKDILAREKERFAAQSADLEARYKALEKTAGEISGLASENRQSSAANAAKIGHVDKTVKRLLKETAGIKRQYRAEVDRLLKDLEG